MIPGSVDHLIHAVDDVYKKKIEEDPEEDPKKNLEEEPMEEQEGELTEEIEEDPKE